MKLASLSCLSSGSLLTSRYGMSKKMEGQKGRRSQSIELKLTAVRWRRISDGKNHTTPDDAEATFPKI